MQPSESNKQIALQEDIQRAVTAGIRNYFQSCRGRIPGFIKRHFSYPAALTTNRVAFGFDILRAPVNLFWAPLFALVCMIRFFVGRSSRLGWLYHWLDRFPAGFTTRVQTHISELVLSDLLQHDRSHASLSWFIAEELRALYQKNEANSVDMEYFHDRDEPVVEEARAQ